ncbi:MULTISPECIES: hypothetical protein [Sphingomonas]|uniref:Uncharacterized protein n=1 Tax=Sphingomonas leidyi TaxID=68569 RepID=A0A7X5V072_9SPHN|nr:MULTISPECIES: hypothetical protein [Sphingomonas]MBN8813094.1 hypothetical protein [Sphingomonas sp.]NIJ64847.1 hypothetical protein [Sphingomonas leidyi]
MELVLEKSADIKEVSQGFSDVVDWRKYDGQRVKGSSGPNIYLMLNGILRIIPNPQTYVQLFRNWDGISVNDYLVDNAPSGEPLTNGSVLINDGGRIYLVTLSHKMWVPDMPTYNRFNFGMAIAVPPIVAQYIPTGPNVG